MTPGRVLIFVVMPVVVAALILGGLAWLVLREWRQRRRGKGQERMSETWRSRSHKEDSRG